MKKLLASVLFAVMTLASGAAVADNFPNNASVNIPGLGNYTLEMAGTDAQGDGIYALHHSSGNYLSVNSGNENEPVTLGAAQSQWVLHQNSNGWSIMSAANEANAVTKTDGGWVLKRNQGAAGQIWAIN